MQYSFVGFLIPAESEINANNTISKINCILSDSECDLSNAYCMAGIHTIDNMNAFGKDFEQFLAKYSHKLYNMIDEE